MFPRLCTLPALLLLLLLPGCTGDILGKRDAVDPQVAVESGARRLSLAELDNTLKDLLGEESRPASRLLNEDEFRPYDNDYTIQSASQALITSLQILAEEVAANTVNDPTRRDALVPCTPSGPGDEDCFRQFLEAFLPRAFRRSISADDVTPYLSLLAFATESSAHVESDFDSAVRLAVSAALQDPEFLYRIELGRPDGDDGVIRLDAHAVASRMSYLLWGTMPDEALFAAAEGGMLDSAEGRREEARRMFEDPRARAQLGRFHAMWLGYRSIPHSPDLVARLDRETSALIERVIFDEPGSYLRLFTTGETYLDDALADHYGLPRPAGGEGWVPYADTGRAGILSHGSVLAGFGKFEDTSPTQRGIMVRTRFMCEEVPPPPPNLDVDEPPSGTLDSPCKYDRYAQHRDASGTCAVCHSLMDPIGFGLENYDMAGRFRTHDDGLPECVIEGEGEIVGLGQFSGPGELAELLVDEGYIDECAVQQFLTYAIGREVQPEEDALITRLVDDFRGVAHDFRGFVVEYIASERFVRRAEERL